MRAYTGFGCQDVMCIFKQSLAGYGDQSTYKYKWDMSVMVAEITMTLIITCIYVEV